MNAAQQSFNSLLQAYMSQPPQMEQSIDKRRIEVLLQINTVLLYKCVGLQQYVMNQQNTASPNYNEKKELYQNYLKRIHYNLTCLASINDIYSNTPSVKRNYTLPQMVYPPPECLELFDHYKLLNLLYPEAMPFFQKKMALARQQQLQNAAHATANAFSNQTTADTQEQQQGVQYPNLATQAPAQAQLTAASMVAATRSPHWPAHTKLHPQQQPSGNHGSPHEQGSAKSQHINLATGFDGASMNGLPVEAMADFKYQQQQHNANAALNNTGLTNTPNNNNHSNINLNGANSTTNATNTPTSSIHNMPVSSTVASGANNFTMGSFNSSKSDNGMRRSSNQTQGTNITPQMTPQAILQQSGISSNQPGTPLRGSEFNPILSPEQILARAATSQSIQTPNQYQQFQQYPNANATPTVNANQNQTQTEIQVPQGHDSSQQDPSQFQFNADPNFNQNQIDNVGGFISGW